METMYKLYPLILLIHVLSAIIWLGFFPVQISYIKSITSEFDWDVKQALLKNFLKVTNTLGMIGATGIVLTGIILVLLNPVYNFFEFKANHWLTTKQFVILIILFIIITRIIPLSKNLKINMMDSQKDNKIFTRNFNKLIRLLSIEKVLVFINFLLAYLHRFYF